MEDLHTKRLTLVALTPEFARVAMENRVELGRMLEARVPETWQGADFARMLPHFAQGVEQASPVAEPTRLIVHTANRTLIGETGFHRPPDASGTVEVGFSIVPEYRGRGFASEATRALIDRALAHSGISRIVAESLEDNVASLKVLQKLGMRRVGSAGDTLRFELRKR